MLSHLEQSLEAWELHSVKQRVFPEDFESGRKAEAIITSTATADRWLAFRGWKVLPVAPSYFPEKSLNFILHMSENIGESCLWFLILWFPHGWFPNPTHNEASLYFSVLNYLKFDLLESFALLCLWSSWFMKWLQWLTSASGLSPHHQQLKTLNNIIGKPPSFCPQTPELPAAFFLFLTQWLQLMIKVIKLAIGWSYHKSFFPSHFICLFVVLSPQLTFAPDCLFLFSLKASHPCWRAATLYWIESMAKSLKHNIKGKSYYTS